MLSFSYFWDLIWPLLLTVGTRCLSMLKKLVFFVEKVVSHGCDISEVGRIILELLK